MDGNRTLTPPANVAAFRHATIFAQMRSCSAGKLISATLFSSSFFLVNPPTSSHVSPCLAPFSSPRLFPRPGWQELSTMCLLTREITRTGRGGRNTPDGQEVDSTVWFSWLGDGERERERGETVLKRYEANKSRRRMKERLRVRWRNWLLSKWTEQESTERASSYCVHRLSNGIPGGRGF